MRVPGFAAGTGISGQIDVHPRSLPRFALDLDLAAVQFHNPQDVGKTESNAILPTGKKRIARAPSHLFAHAFALVSNRHSDRISLTAGCGHNDTAFDGRGI